MLCICICICRTASIVAFVALLTAGPAFTETPASEQVSKEVAAAATVANVYVQTTKGVNVYNATAAGKLTLVKGSPFSTLGYMQGINGKYLVSVGSWDVGTNLFSYEIKSDGGIGPVVSALRTQDYAGSECGNFYPAYHDATLDHTGKYFYLHLLDQSTPAPACEAWQSYLIGPHGELSFLGDYVSDQALGALTISSNDSYIYGSTDWSSGSTGILAYTKTSSGDLVANPSFTETDLLSNPSNGWPYYLIGGPKADPAGHLAAVVFASPNPLGPTDGPWQMASYTINEATGGIVSTNTWKDMPVTHEASFAGLRMSPSGKVLVVVGDGLELFHFNGAAPMTPFKYLLPDAGFFVEAGWDNNNHLYAFSVPQSGPSGVYAFTVTPTSISPVPGSPFKLTGADGWDRLIVVPKL
jgi:hypothetical protein